MIHCELDADSIQTAFRRSDGGNGIFIRTPYNKLPFHADAFDTVICTDTLIRGWDHERVLLGEINRILKPGGKAVVDFHNNRLQINGDICLYSRRKIQALLASANIMNYDIYPFGYVPSLLVPKESLYPYLDRACGLLLPCQRHIVVFTKSGGAPR
jgi:SAM-dependent methyltransferase